MKPFVILPDSACDLGEELRASFGLTDYVRGHLTLPDGTQVRTCLDWDDILQEKEFYRRLGDRKKTFVTAPANTEEYYRIFSAYAEKGIDVLSVSLTSSVSATYSFACMAAKRVCEEHPEARIRCVDSFRTSTAIGLLVCWGLRMQSGGSSLDEVADWMEENKHRIHQMGPIDDLFYAARRGRLQMSKAILGTFAGVRPMGDFSPIGYTGVIGKVKGMRHALEVTAEYVRRTAEDPEKQFFIISHCDRPAEAETLRSLLAQKLPTAERIYVTCVYPACGVSIGPGMVGVHYLGEPIRDNMDRETAVLQDILTK